MAKIIKSDSSLQKLKLNELPKNNIIRALACLVCPISDYGLRELYQFLDIRVTDRTSDIKYLISNGFSHITEIPTPTIMPLSISSIRR